MEKSEMLKGLQSAKSKLTAAISMLLVSAILFTNVTYAWFVLSTAPEVTGVSTTTGANGALEIALQSTDSSTGTAQRAVITSGVGDSSALASQPVTEANKSWGNIVDISTGYGLEDITLYPARLNISSNDSGSTVDRQYYLSVPQYGTDGRISSFRDSEKLVFADDAYQTVGTNYGVNVHGFPTEAGTEQQIVSQYKREIVRREAVAQVNSRRTALREDLVKVIEDNGHGLITMMFTVVMMMGAPREWSESEKTTIKNLINEFDRVATESETALRWALLANVMADIDKYDPSVTSDMETLGEIYSSFLEMDLSSTDSAKMTIQSIAATNGYDELAEAVTTLEGIQNMLLDAQADIRGGNYGDAGLEIVSKDHTYLMCGTVDSPVPFVDGFMANMGKRFTDDLYFVGAENITSAGFFPAMASILGDYPAVIDGWVDPTTYTAQKEESANTVLFTFNSKSTSKYGNTAAQSVAMYSEENNKGILWDVYEEANAVTAEGTIPLYTTRGDVTAYGYSVDLAFRSSEGGELVLQQEATSRVSEDSTTVNTMGGGSTMTFEVYGNMTSAQIKSLLQSVYVVFMNSESGRIYAVGKADANDVEVVVADVTAPLTLYELDLDAMSDEDAEEGVLILGDAIKDNVITTLTADTPAYITAVVYLNGDTVSSSDVSHQGQMSLIGSINMQFAMNDVEMTSMTYTDYYTASDDNP